jgi:hypothetical protein
MAACCQALPARLVRAARWVTAAPAVRWVAARSGTGPDEVGMVMVMWRCSARCRAGSYGVRFCQHCHTTRVRVPQLVWCEATAHTGQLGDTMQLAADPGRSARPTAWRTAHDAKQRTGRQRRAQFEPRLDVCPCPSVHCDFTTLVAVAVTDEHHAAIGVEVSLTERKGFADPQASAPQHDDDAAQPQAVGTLASGAHYEDDLLHCRWVRWVAKPLVSRGQALVEAGEGCGRAARDRHGPAAIGIPWRPPVDGG